MGEILTLNLLTSMAELVRVRAMWYVLPDLTVPNATRVGYRRNPYAKISFNKKMCHSYFMVFFALPGVLGHSRRCSHFTGDRSLDLHSKSMTAVLSQVTYLHMFCVSFGRRSQFEMFRYFWLCFPFFTAC